MAKDVSFAEWLNEQLQVSGYNQRELAKLAGVKPATIYKLLNGKTRRPNPETCEGIARALGISPNTVLRAARIKLDEPKYPESDDLNHIVEQLAPEMRRAILAIAQALKKLN